MTAPTIDEFRTLPPKEQGELVGVILLTAIVSDRLDLSPQETAELAGLTLVYNRVAVTDQERHEMAELCPLDGPLPSGPEAAARWRRLTTRQHQRWHRFCARLMARPPVTRPAAVRPRVRRTRAHSGTSASRGDPPGDDGDPDPDPAERRIRELVAAAPEFTAGQLARLAAIIHAGSVR